MATEEQINEAVTEENAADTKETKEEKKRFLSDSKIELITAIFLGLTALMTAWATWIGSLHGGNQATNYARSNNLAAEANAEYNVAAQLYFSDLLSWNTLLDYQFDKQIGEAKDDKVSVEQIEQKLDTYAEQNCSDILNNAIDKMTDDMTSPFEVEGVVESYFDKYNELIEQSNEALEQGRKDNANGDSFNLVTVIYSLVLFLLGIVGIFKNIPNRAFILGVSIVGVLLTTIFMFTIPMPTDFDFFSYF